MEDFAIKSINSVGVLNVAKIHKILASPELTDAQKADFIRKNSSEIKSVMKQEISRSEFAQMMQNRPLIRFRPLKNSFTKQGDKILLAKSLGISTKEIKKYINDIIDTNFEIQDNLRKDNIEKVKTYVYRHGTKDEVVAFLRYELSDVRTTLEKLYKTMEDNSGGLCDYFSRPIHRMSNITLGKLYNTIDSCLRESEKAGFITKEKYNSTAIWALVRIYQIQNNSKLIRAYNLYKDLTDV